MVGWRGGGKPAAAARVKPLRPNHTEEVDKKKKRVQRDHLSMSLRLVWCASVRKAQCMMFLLLLAIAGGKSKLIVAHDTEASDRTESRERARWRVPTESRELRVPRVV